MTKKEKGGSVQQKFYRNFDDFMAWQIISKTAQKFNFFCKILCKSREQVQVG